MAGVSLGRRNGAAQRTPTMTHANDTVVVHPLAHIAPGPYVFLGLSTQDDRDREAGEAKAHGRAYTTNTSCGGSCDLCGMAISNVYRFRGADGRAFKLGCDCAELGFANSPDMVARVREAKREMNRERRRAASEARRAAEAEARAIRDRKNAEAREAERQANIAAQRERNPEWYEWAAALADADGFPGKIGRDFAGIIDEGHPLSVKQAKLLHSLYMQYSAPDEGHYGEPGKRAKGVELTCEGTSVMEGRYGLSTVYRFRTSCGKALVCFHSGAALDVEIGNTVTAAFTVKSHDEYQGKASTKINRIKIG